MSPSRNTRLIAIIKLGQHTRLNNFLPTHAIWNSESTFCMSLKSGRRRGAPASLQGLEFAKTTLLNQLFACLCLKTRWAFSGFVLIVYSPITMVKFYDQLQMINSVSMSILNAELSKSLVFWLEMVRTGRVVSQVQKHCTTLLCYSTWGGSLLGEPILTSVLIGLFLKINSCILQNIWRANSYGSLGGGYVCL